MKLFSRQILTLLFLIFSQATFAQESEENEVKQVIKNLFDAMRTSDAKGLSSCFNSDAILETVYIKDGESKVHRSKAQEFIDGVTTEHKEVYNEVIKKYKIEVDGIMASVWAPYEFYLDDTFLHCGVNSIQLFKSNEGWKITYVIDTRRTEGCID
jgi:hypothetical protein